VNTDAVERLSQQIEAGRAALVSGASDLPAAVMPLWREALKEIDAGVKASEPVARQVERVWGHREHTLPHRQEQSEALVRGLSADVSAHLERAERNLADIAFQLQEGVNPPRPQGVSEAAVLDRKGDVAELLRRQGGALDGITQLMTEAITQHDELTAYVLSPGGPLEWTYRILGVDRPRLRSALYRAVRAARREPVPGEGLLRMYEATHEDPQSWQQLRTAIEGLVGAVGSAAAYAYRQAAINSPGWGVPSEAQRLAEQQAAATAMRGAPVSAPEADNLRMRQGYPGEPVPGNLKPSLDTSAVVASSGGVTS